MKLANLGLALLAALSLSACRLNTQNSSSRDEELFAASPEILGPQSVQETQASSLIQSKCVTCHFYDHSAFARYTKSDWVARGYVSPGSLSGSRLYTRLKGAELRLAPESMPPTQALSTTELGVIRDWIVSWDHSGLSVPGAEASPEVRASAARGVLQRNACFECHSKAEAFDAPFFSPELDDFAFRDLGLIQAGHPERSPLFLSLRPSKTYPELPGTMPLFRLPLDDNDLKTLENWILYLR